MSVGELECVDVVVYTGSDANLTWNVLETDYPNPSTFDWQLQIMDPNDTNVALVTLTGTANITGTFEFITQLPEASIDLLELGVGHEALLKDTTDNEFIGRMCIYPKLGQRA